MMLSMVEQFQTGTADGVSASMKPPPFSGSRPKRVELCCGQTTAPHKTKARHALRSLLTLSTRVNLNLTKISLKFLESGHSFMSADVVHANIEKVFRKKRSKSRFELDLKETVEKQVCTVYNYDKAH